jgi:putative ABC transport system permease protein
VVEVLKEFAARGRSRRSLRTLNAIVVLQFAVSTTLLVGAGMLVRSYVRAASPSVGFQTASLMTATLDLDQISLDDAGGIRFYREAMRRLSALPNVADVSLTRTSPLLPAPTATVLADDTISDSDVVKPIVAGRMIVSSRYFTTVGAELQGRSFTDMEPQRPLVAVVNEPMASRLWHRRAVPAGASGLAR